MPSNMPISESHLKREVLSLGLQGSGFILISSTVLIYTDTFKIAVSFLTVSFITWVYVLTLCYRRLSLNYDTKTGLSFDQLGAGNRITLLRGLLIAATAGFLGSTPATLSALALFLPAVLYTIAAIGDALDGYVARITKQATQLGKELDNELDALGLLIAPLLAILWDKLHVSYMSVSLAFYIFRIGIYLRKRLGLKVSPLPASALRRRLAGYQMGLVATALWAPIPAELTQPIGFLLMAPLLCRFILDWLYVSDRISDS